MIPLHEGGYSGQYDDSSIGLYYNRFRYYDPETGQYTQVDPIGLAGANPTLYGYVLNPFFEIDIWGLTRWKLGDPINQNNPSWNTARRRYWRNQWNEYMRTGDRSGRPFDFNKDNIDNMRHGRAPLDANGRPIELHHIEPQANKPPDVHNQNNLREMTREQHIEEHRRMREEARRNNNSQGNRSNAMNSKGCPLP